MTSISIGCFNTLFLRIFCVATFYCCFRFHFDGYAAITYFFSHLSLPFKLKTFCLFASFQLDEIRRGYCSCSNFIFPHMLLQCNEFNLILACCSVSLYSIFFFFVVSIVVIAIFFIAVAILNIAHFHIINTLYFFLYPATPGYFMLPRAIKCIRNN